MQINLKKSKFLENITSQGFIQFANIILPIIILPFLLRVLGPHEFGLYSVSHSIYSLAIIISDYGFNLSAVQEIAINRCNKKYISTVFWSVVYSKLIISLLLSIGITLFILLYPLNNTIQGILFASILGLIFNSLYSQWFFQGIEKTKIIAIIVFFARVSTLVFTLINVEAKGDSWKAMLANSIGAVITATFSLFFLKINHLVVIVKPSFALIKQVIKDGWHLFISTLSISFYSAAMPSLIGLLAGPTAVGYYSAADKIRQGFASVFSPISTAYFPRISYLLIYNRWKALREIKILISFYFILSTILGILMYYNSSFLVNTFAGESFNESISVLKIFSPVILFSSLSNILGVQLMLNLGQKRKFSIIILSAAFFNLFLLFILAPIYGSIGAALSVLFTEILVFLIMLINVTNLLYKDTFI